MFIDYIYLLLTIILICFIIFLIYLSYEYRNIGINEPNEILENFETPKLNEMNEISFDLYNYNKLINNIDKSYYNLNSEINNRDVTTDNIKNLKLFDKITKNLLNTEKIINLKKNIIKTQDKEEYPVDKLIKTIKSKYNAQYISTIGYDKKKYSIIANDKCLTVSGLCKEPYCLLDCQKGLNTSDSQKFQTERIENEIQAAKFMNTTLSKISTNNVYPFNIFKSLVNNNCLTLTDDGITVEDCNINNIKQQWEISPNDNICVLN